MRDMFQTARPISALPFFMALLFMTFSSARAAELPKELQGVGITEHLGETLALNELRFTDESGHQISLANYFKSGRPVLLNLVYYECPNLCTFVLNGLVKALKDMDWVPGKQFEVVSVSIDPKEKASLATRKKSAYISAYGKPEGAAGWHFLTGEVDSIRKLAAQIGFGYRYDERDRQFAHSAAIFALTPAGKISRYLYGIEYKPTDLKLSLLEASNGKIGTVIDRLLLFCYRYDPLTRKYSVYLTKVMQAGSAGTVVLFGAYLAVFWRRQRRKERD